MEVITWSVTLKYSTSVCVCVFVCAQKLFFLLGIYEILWKLFKPVDVLSLRLIKVIYILMQRPKEFQFFLLESKCEAKI